LVQAGLEDRLDGREFQLIRLTTATAGIGLGCFLGVFVSGSLMLIPLLAWTGYIVPLRVLVARRKRRQAEINRCLPETIGMIRAFLTSGMPLERTLHVLSRPGPPDNPLKAEIRRSLGRYGLGATIEQALAEMGPRTGVDDLEAFVTSLSQSTRSGTGLETALRDHELMVRMNQRHRATAQAAAVSTKLLGVLAAVYLPEFVILIIIPLFWGIMQRAFG
jgi:tight adherence protein C